MIQRGIKFKGVEAAERGGMLVEDNEVRPPGKHTYDVTVVTGCELTQKEISDAVWNAVPHVRSVSVSAPLKG
jgi:hypothetical protein